MGSYNEWITGQGKTKREAFQNAWDEYVFENGHRCSYRSTASATLIKKVPPDKPFHEMKGRMEYISSRPDINAPPSEWLEVWQFEVWVHS